MSYGKSSIITDPDFDTYVCIDIETTSRPSNRIIELGAVKVIKGRPEKVFSRLVDPGIKIPGEVVKLTGITNTMVKGRRSIWKIMPEFKEFIGDNIIVGHDVVANDMKNLISAGNFCGITFENPVFDTLAFSRSMINGSCGLSHLTDLLWVNWDVRHRAANDAQATMEVFEKLKIMYNLIRHEHIDLRPDEMTRIAKRSESFSGLSLKFGNCY